MMLCYKLSVIMIEGEVFYLFKMIWIVCSLVDNGISGFWMMRCICDI